MSGYSDLDIRIQFKKDSFSTLEEMVKDVTDYLRYEFHDYDLVKVRKQNSSAGLIFNQDGQEIIIDVVPARRDNFIRGENTYNLYRNKRGRKNETTRVKINPYKQNDFGDFAEDKKNVIRLIKLLKYEQDIPLKSILIEELTKKAFDESYEIPLELEEQVLMTLEYIEHNIETTRVISPDNSNNNLTKKLSNRKKKAIANDISDIKFDLEFDDGAWKKYFPIN